MRTDNSKKLFARATQLLPGGVDSHAHIEQLSAAGIMNADTFESATTSAAFGGTTSVISFAAQHVGMHLPQVVSDYHALPQTDSRRSCLLRSAVEGVLSIARASRT